MVHTVDRSQTADVYSEPEVFPTPDFSSAHSEMGNFSSAYDYSTIEYKNTANTESLSWLTMEGKEGDMVDSMLKNFLADGLPLTAADIAGETVEDPILSHAYQYVLGGWGCE